jgi:hypothetical protein
MTNDDIFYLAEKNGYLDDFGRWNFKDEGLLDFVHEILIDEREACAKVCDGLAAQDKLSNYYAVAARAIRKRGEP